MTLDDLIRFDAWLYHQGNPTRRIAMQSTFRVHADDLTADFVQAFKIAYKDKEIEIVVSDVVDETDYLLITDANHEHLIGAIKNIESGENLVSFSLEDLPRT
jgi:hypothetical protein